MSRMRFVFSGSGGQGVITAAIVLAESAVLYENLIAVQAQSYGPEARGGATRSDVIIDNKDILFPKVTQPNFLVCLTQEAYHKFSPIVRPGGTLLSDPNLVKIHKKADARQIQLPMYETVMAEVKKPIVFNICMLGAVIALTEVVKTDSILKVLEKRIPAEFIDMNKQALELGFSLGESYRI
ncbi:MAG: 2-oxoglutarate ferredoxin oxidoreductase subunit gamma [Candidatus Magnetoglobus multicellularis str. Araruama]|uniref:2-oxoglutarate ferredoxin oxidoreductase subunit gamma n=1 Tax=Candidatus Magnetoglobus multicellularis str. Araruama TaxID=890399 RepID=A0A1V1PBG4_9BACT|nr:MAG: 2-oxoglutarate ferredoxin oxidoreductase subunit gamma [Candidatus Magnetoglobus multicellularis str. Araruama]